MSVPTLAVWPVSMESVRATRTRIGRYIPATPLRRYRQLDDHVGGAIEISVKHENHQPTNSFKIRNGLSFMTSLSAEQLERGVVAASTGNHGQGIAYAGSLLGADVTICVPVGNNPEKNAAMRSYGARVVEDGRDYDEAVAVMLRIAREEGRTVAHSTNDPAVVAGAATMTLEMLEQQPDLDALVLAVGGGSQAVGALTVARSLRPSLRVFGVQAAGASAIHDSWHAREPRTTERADTFAEGVATRTTYELTFPTLLDGLTGFITVTDAEIASAMRVILGATHNLVEGAGALGLAGLLKLREQLTGKRVGIVFSGGNVDAATLRRVLNREL
jgi:threonine dehydratase